MVKFDKNIARKKEIQDFIDNNPDKFTIISPEETAVTIAKQAGGYFKGRSVMGPSKKHGSSS